MIDSIFTIVLFILSAVVHEIAHGYAALRLGDPTAKNLGRLSVNPLKHLDPFGSVFLPALLAISQSGFIFGWAKPVPYNPYNLKYGKWGEALVALAGPFSNFAIALVFGLLLRFSGVFGSISPDFLSIASLVVIINLILAVFNLVPIPPMDGSKVLFAFLPFHLNNVREFLERWGMFFVIAFIIFGWELVSPLVLLLFGLITGFGY